MATITFSKATRTYPQMARAAVDDLDLEVKDGELLVLVGPSGCGKSTSLRMLAGLEPVDSGEIRIGARDVTHLAPKARDIAMVFQNYALYPHMTVAENMAFSLRMARVSNAEQRERVLEASRMLDLEGLLERRPKQLSGGQRQRVAMGRAIVRHPKAFLMDEPLSNLDAKLRVQTRTQIAELQRRLGVTTVYVTHDQVEAMTMGDRVAVLRDGVLQQCETPLDLYDRPANAFVAGFIGSPAMNLLEVPVRNFAAVIGDLAVPLSSNVLSRLESDSVTVGFRAEAVTPAQSGAGTEFVVDVVEELGADAYLYGRMTSVPDAPVIAVRAQGRRAATRGTRLCVSVDPEALHVFAPDTGERIG